MTSADYMTDRYSRHTGGENLAFCDGHAGPWSKLHTETDPAGKEALDAHNAANSIQIGFLSGDNEIYDLK